MKMKFYSILTAFVLALFTINLSAQSTANKDYFTVDEVDAKPYIASGDCMQYADAEQRNACNDRALLVAFYKNIKYPAEARENGITGIVEVEFYITAAGHLVDVKVIGSVHPSLDRAGVDAVKSLAGENWVPAQKDGKAVKYYYTMPVRFKL